jgi:hypothetical protein
MSTAAATARSAAAQALARCGGDAAAARRMLVRAAGADPRLMAAIVEPHLEAIVARLVQAAAAAPAAAAAAGPSRSADDLDRVMGELGARIGARAQPRGMTALIDPPVAAPAGARHQDAVRTLAAAFRRPRGVKSAPRGRGKAPKAPQNA